jgi:hypothetical protein
MIGEWRLRDTEGSLIQDRFLDAYMERVAQTPSSILNFLNILLFLPWMLSLYASKIFSTPNFAKLRLHSNVSFSSLVYAVVLLSKSANF